MPWQSIVHPYQSERRPFDYNRVAELDWIMHLPVVQAAIGDYIIQQILRSPPEETTQ